MKVHSLTYHHIRACLECDLLTAHILLASADQHSVHTSIHGELHQHCVDLLGQLSSRCDYQYTDGGNVLGTV